MRCWGVPRTCGELNWMVAPSIWQCQNKWKSQWKKDIGRETWGDSGSLWKWSCSSQSKVAQETPNSTNRTALLPILLLWIGILCTVSWTTGESVVVNQFSGLQEVQTFPYLTFRYGAKLETTSTKHRDRNHCRIWSPVCLISWKTWTKPSSRRRFSHSCDVANFVSNKMEDTSGSYYEYVQSCSWSCVLYFQLMLTL